MRSTDILFFFNEKNHDFNLIESNLFNIELYIISISTYSNGKLSYYITIHVL